MKTLKPKPGTDVHMVIIAQSAYRHAKPTFAVDCTIIDTPFWEQDPSVVGFIVPGDHVPVRTVRMDHVASINGELVQGWTESASSQVREWPVRGSKGDWYMVRFDGEKWTCECRGFVFHRHCHHIREVKEANESLHTAS